MAILKGGKFCRLREVELRRMPEQLTIISPKATGPVLVQETGELLEEALNDLEDLRSRSELTSPGGGRTYNPGWHQALEIGAMVDVSKMCAIAALRREESRGAHTRDDFPETDDNHWGKINSVILMGDDGSMNIDFVSYPKIPKDLRSLLDSDDLKEEE